MSHVLRLLGLLLAVAAVASAACLLTCRWAMRHQTEADHLGAVSAHQWAHRELKLTPPQDATLHSIEQKYAARRAELTTAIRQANAELARAIREDRAESPKVAAAVDKIHQAQGELQTLTLEHVFEMHQALSPEQYDRLLTLTASALEADGQ